MKTFTWWIVNDESGSGLGGFKTEAEAQYHAKERGEKWRVTQIDEKSLQER